MKKNLLLMLLAFFLPLFVSAQIDASDFKEYEKTDFVPGEKIIFFDDFSSAKQSAWRLNAENKQVELNNLPAAGGSWFKVPRSGTFFPQNLSTLPENFTLEFDMYAEADKVSEMQSGLKVFFTQKIANLNEFDQFFDDLPKIAFDIHPFGTAGYAYVPVWGRNKNREEEVHITAEDTRHVSKGAYKSGKVNRIAAVRTGNTFRFYINQTKIIDLPAAFVSGLSYNLIFAADMWEEGLFISNVKIATGLAKVKEELGKGKFVTANILFDTNSDKIKPQSYSILKQIADAVKAQAGKIIIVGHTDNTGNPAANLTLSEKRAESVKNALVQLFGINAAQFSSQGKGQNEPLNGNTNDTEKAQNRRVEFIKAG